MHSSFVLLCVLLAIFAAKNVLVTARAVEVFDLEEDAAECVEELNLDKNKITEISKTPFLPEDDEDFSNFVNCTWKKRGLINPETGGVNYVKVEQMFAQYFTEEFALEGSSSSVNTALEILKKAIRRCKNEVNETKPIKIQNCVLTEFDNITENYLKYV